MIRSLLFAATTYGIHGNDIDQCLDKCDSGPTCDCDAFQPRDSNCRKAQSCANALISGVATREASADGTRASGLAYATTENLSMKLSSIAGPKNGQFSADWKLTVDDTASGKRQEITGFGAAWTGATVAVFEELPTSQQEQVMEDLFGSSGIGLGLMRHTIGQSDLTPSWVGKWSYDENGDQPDPQLSGFDLTDMGRNMVKWISRMIKVKPDVTLFGSVWSPPAWMKQDNTIQWQYVDSWVSYMVKYLTTFKEQGINLHALTMQNEPLHSADSAWTTRIDESYSAILANKLGPAITQAGLQTEIWAYDHNTDVPDYPDYVLKNAPEHVNTVAWHCYSSAGWKPLTDFHNTHPGVKQYMTECWTHLQGESFFDLPGFVTGPLQNYASGALAWTLGGSTAYDVSYPGGCAQCSGIIQVDRSAKSYEKTQDYYTLGQFSKFVQKGAMYLSGTGSYTYPDGTGVQATNFLNPNGDRVIVIVNKIRNGLNIEVTFASGDVWNGFVPSRSVTTWVIPQAKEPLVVAKVANSSQQMTSSEVIV